MKFPIIVAVDGGGNCAGSWPRGILRQRFGSGRASERFGRLDARRAL